jgi:hypothetical protein
MYTLSEGMSEGMKARLSEGFSEVSPAKREN